MGSGIIVGGSVQEERVGKGNRCMEVRWSAVLSGLLVDLLLSIFIRGIASWLALTTFLNTPDGIQPPDLTHTPDLILFGLLLLATGIGGYIAGRLARRSHVLNGFMVGVVGIVVTALLNIGAPAPDHLFIFGQIAGCGLGALGGYLSRFSFGREV